LGKEIEFKGKKYMVGKTAVDMKADIALFSPVERLR
jgi:hypothetical protein